MVLGIVTQTPNIIWSPSGFITPAQVSLSRSDAGFEPFLHVLPSELSGIQCESFFRAAGVNENFAASHYAGVLKLLSQRYSSAPLIPGDLDLSLKILDQISRRQDETLATESLLAPDHSRILRPCTQLCFNNLPWMKSVQLPNETFFCHENISFGLCQKLGVPSQRESMLAQAMQPLPFGQHEDLTTRLQNIISGYPLGIELFKELIQNADDAGASKISFIIDRRHHGTERVLSDSWKELQGPALLVYNDSTFSDADIEGIQNLGLGSKRDDAWKAGQYGIGFNCVYNITDAPSFLSDGKIFCVMDPHCGYMPGATLASPGGMYKNVECLKYTFRDVFAGYCPESLKQTGGTVFRLPLRTVSSAKKSRICERSVSADDIKQLFDEFKNELGRTALFLLNIREVQLSEVWPDNKFTTVFAAKLEVETVSGCFDNYKEACETASQHLRSRGAQLSCIPVSSVTYELTVSGTGTNFKQRWLVFQKLGGGLDHMPAQLQQQVASGKWRLLPKTGVAAPISMTETCRVEGHVYCLLPLPVTTALPVHVNGHFILDPSRRSLWKADGAVDVKEQWNQVLATQLLPDCYGSLLEAAKTVYPNVQNVHHFYSLLPEYHASNQTLWGQLAKLVFQNAFRFRWAIFPVHSVLEKQLKWLPLAQSSGDVSGSAAFLTPYNLTAFLQNILSKLRFPIMVPDHVGLRQSLESSQLEFSPVADAVSICAFLRGPACKQLRDSLPSDVSTSSFQTPEAVVSLLKYLLDELQDEVQHLIGVPLNLGAGNRLTEFDNGRTPLFLTQFHDLFSHSEAKHEFVHKKVLFQLDQNKKNNLIQKQLCKKFQLMDFCTLLHREHAAICRTDSAFLPNSEFGMEAEFLEQWLNRVWEFLDNKCTNKNAPMQTLSSSGLGSAHLIPVNQSRFASLSLAPCIYEPIRFGLDDCSKAVEESLQQLNAPSLSMMGLKLVGSLCGNVRQPESMLRVMEFALNENAERSTITEKQAVSFLVYIQSNWGELSKRMGEQNLLARVRQLPVFVTSDGRCCALKSEQACILPASLVTDEMDEWKSSSKAIFLKANWSLTMLYAKLQCDEMAELEVYARFILPVFSKFTDDTRKKHLEKLCELSWDFERVKVKNPDKFQMLSQSLRAAKLIPFDGQWWSVNTFYDGNVEIFKKFLQPQCFLPTPYNEERWRKLMKFSGLILECTAPIAISFASELQTQGAIGITDELSRKSEALLKFIDSYEFRKDRTESVVRQLAGIQFIVANSDGALQSLCQSDRIRMASLSQCALFEARFLCWTAMPYGPSCVGQGSCFASSVMPVSDAIFLRHVVNLFSAATFTSADLRGEVATLRSDVMNSVYSRLSTIMNSTAVQSILFLKDIPCVLIKTEGYKSFFVSAGRITQDKNSAILPYIHECPQEFSQFRKLFAKLGATESATIEQLRLALELIRNEQQGSLRAEQLKSVSHCLSSIIVLLERGGRLQFESDRVLFLPKRSQHQDSSTEAAFELVDCRCLTINDSEAHNNRLVDAQDVQFLDLSFCKLGTDKLQRLYFHLAADMGLKKLSDNVSERLLSDTNKFCSDGESCETLLGLQAKLSHPMLHLCIVSIMLHGNKDLSGKGDERLAAVKSLISRFSVVCLSELRTCLLLDGVEQQDSEQDKNFFLDGQRILMNHSTIPDEMSGDRRQLWQMDFIKIIMQILNYGVNILPEQKSYLIQVLLMDSPDSMLAVLHGLGIALHQTSEQQFAEPSATDDSVLVNLYRSLSSVY
ncbi:hypothetical protein BOX15_Mlig002925g1 [Macrostomum lignano]|uniref:Sacsin/Nov domain-containing protein n=1 Tax=Macrostomum lignano TaxID=282301 RepID=A0A267EY30_9PLAT|nr:hypothetical protein BOX15_Mlig002925g1 [Macrostomum lignano]